ncbi:MAG TPA: hypothetical protein VGE21_03555 [Flavobacteriales bacterium]
MWPVLTLTLLLQLTDEEQLYAERTTPPQPQEQEQVIPAPEETLQAIDPSLGIEPQG